MTSSAPAGGYRRFDAETLSKRSKRPLVNLCQDDDIHASVPCTIAASGDKELHGNPGSHSCHIRQAAQAAALLLTCTKPGQCD
jgi:hypothetical protein